MDLTQTIIAKSDQLNADDLISGPQTFTVTDVRMGDSEQPVCIVLAEWPGNRPFKPSKTVLRILVHAWGKESDNWPKGARMTLYRDADVKWAGQAIGGIRVSHLSHIAGKLKVALQESKGKKVLYTVDPLPEAAVTRPDTAPGTLIDSPGLARLHASLTELGVGKGMKADPARQAKLNYCSAALGRLDRPLGSSAEITTVEASRLYEAIKADLRDQRRDEPVAEPELTGWNA